MTSRAFFHYILAFTVLFASSFAVFHGSEHIAIGKTNVATASFTVTSSGFHSASEHHELGDPDSPKTSHSIESLCEACLVLSNLHLLSSGYTFLGLSLQKSKHRRFNPFHSNKQSFQTYLSRAPPSNA